MALNLIERGKLSPDVWEADPPGWVVLPYPIHIKDEEVQRKEHISLSSSPEEEEEEEENLTCIYKVDADK